MANIPLGNFGNIMPQAQAGRVLDTGIGQVAQSVNTLAQVGQQASNKKLKEQQKIQDEKDEYTFNIEAAKYGSAYTDVVTETKQRLATGELDEVTAKANLRQKSDELTETYRQTLPTQSHHKFNYYTERMFLESEASVKPLAYETERRKVNADFEQVSEATIKIENREQAYNLYKSTLDKNPVLTPEQRVSHVQEWQQRRDLSDGKAVLSNLEKASDVDGLEKVKNNVNKIFPYMKVETRDAYLGQIDSAIDSIHKNNQVIENKRLTEVKQLAMDYRTDAYTGYPISAERTANVLKQVQGTEYEAQVREDLQLNKDAQTFKQQSPLEQERSINQLRSKLENTPQADASLLQKQLGVFQGIMTTSKQRANNDPVSQLQSQSKQIVKPISPEQIGQSNIDYKAAQVTTDLLAEQKKKNGGIGSLIQWNTAERTAFKDRYFDAIPQQQKAMLTDLTKIAGANKEAQKEYMSLIGGEKNAYDYLGIAELNKRDVVLHGTNIRAADVALEGKQLINRQEHNHLGKQVEFDGQIKSQFGNAATIGSNEYRAYSNIAYSVYIGLAKRNPDNIKVDDKGIPIINQDMAKQAFDIATGGTFKQKFGKNTNNIFMPYGYTQDSFQDHIEEHIRTQYRKETDHLPPSNILNDYAVRPVPNATGWYMFVTPEGQTFKNPKTNKSYVMKIIKE